MTTPTAPQLGTLDYAYQGLPFNNEESKAGQNTNSLDFAYLGLPFVAAAQPSVVTYNTTQFFMVF
jgi:hypothetical protein